MPSYVSLVALNHGSKRVLRRSGGGVYPEAQLRCCVLAYCWCPLLFLRGQAFSYILLESLNGENESAKQLVIVAVTFLEFPCGWGGMSRRIRFHSNNNKIWHVAFCDFFFKTYMVLTRRIPLVIPQLQTFIFIIFFPHHKASDLLDISLDTHMIPSSHSHFPLYLHSLLIAKMICLTLHLCLSLSINSHI